MAARAAGPHQLNAEVVAVLLLQDLGWRQAHLAGRCGLRLGLGLLLAGLLSDVGAGLAAGLGTGSRGRDPWPQAEELLGRLAGIPMGG